MKRINRLKRLICCLWVAGGAFAYCVSGWTSESARAVNDDTAESVTPPALRPASPPHPPPPSQSKAIIGVDFKRDVLPILRSSCFECHAGTTPQGNLRLDARAAALAGGSSGPAIIAGDARASLLIKRVSGPHQGLPRMPPGKPLAAEQVNVLAQWIDEGAVWPEDAQAEGATAASVRPTSASSSARPVDYTRDIEPIFRASCYGCHAGETPMAQLRLDVKELALRGGLSGAVILPGRSGESRLVHRLVGAGDEPRMPFGKDPLTPAQIALIRQWIDEGAAWPERAPAAAQIKKHWSFIAPQRGALPVVRNKTWVRSAIDRYILSAIEKEGLTPSPEAGRETLIRRLSLDLTGLPPTPAEIDQFLADRRPQAYEALVERLLRSPHYGERWARWWLDAARYADSDGYEKDKSRQAWFYRDWVINALNRDLPYDQFIIEQIAGDLLPRATQDQLVATGFLRNSMINEEGGVDPEQFRMEAMFDRMDAIGKSVLGITIQCAQCHTHKYEPLRHEEYYRMFAFLNDSHEANIAVYTPIEQMRRAEIFRQIGEIETELQHRHSDWQEQMAAWEERVRLDQPEWHVVRPEVDDISTGGQRYLPLADESLLAQGYAPTKHRVKLTVRTELQNISAFRLELLGDPNLPLGGPGRSVKGTGALTEFEVEAAPVAAPGAATKIKIARATADINLPETPLDAIFDDKSRKRRVTGPIEYAVDGRDETAWGIDAGPGRRNQPRKAVFAAAAPITNPGGTVLTFYLKQNHGGWNSDDNQSHNLGRIRLAITAAPDASADSLPDGVREILSIPRRHRTPAQTRTLFSYWRTTVPDWHEANRRIEELWRQHPEGSAQLVLQARGEARETTVLARGDFLRPGKAVTPGVPAFLHSLPAGAPPNRLTFARWLVDRNSPTTARSLVNRLWQSYFGTGLVSTAENLGSQGDAPTHPELLDWLAVEFMDRGWSLRSVHRLIVTSATYRQSSRVTKELQRRDPANQLLARGPRLRVEAEAVRDIALAASGLLDEQIGGPSVFPPAPDFLFQPPVSYGPKIWNEAKAGPDRYRRAIYTFRYRSVPYPMLQTFDAPSGDVSCVRRARSNTPLQALTTLNEVLFLESARALARRTLHEGGVTDAQRLTYAFRRVLGRRPTLAERAELLALFSRQHRRFAAGELNPWNLAANDPDKPLALQRGTTVEQLAAWTVVARVLLNLDEAITKE